MPDKRKWNDREPALRVGVLSMPVCSSTDETIQRFSDVSLTRFNKIAIQATHQMAVDKEAF